MKWLCVVSMLSGLAISPVFAQENAVTQGVNAQQRDAFVSNLMKQMTLEEKIGQLRLISVGPDNPKEAIRDGISKGRDWRDLQHRHPAGYPRYAGSGDAAQPPENPTVLCL